MTKKIMPALFIGHGSPTNAIENTKYTEAWKNIVKKIPEPKAILCISAHWYVDKTAVSNLEEPKLIYDFYGFPEEMYKIKYPVHGSPELAQKIKEILSPLVNIEYDNTWGIDHGTWVPIMKMFPEANIPIVQLSIDYTKSGSYHYNLGKALQSLREQGVLIIGSGDIVHNLGVISFGDTTPYPWATEFDELTLKLINNQEYQKLIDFEELPDFKLSIPTPDHYLPLLYILGLQQKDEKLSSFTDGIEYKSISMRGFILE